MSTLLSFLALMTVWVISALLTADPSVLPAPWTVAALMTQEALTGELFHHTAVTLWRVMLAFSVAMGFGTLLGLMMGRSDRINNFLDSWLITLLNLPALVVIVLCYLWIGLNEWAAVIAVAINKIPVIAAMMREGARALDPHLTAMSQVYRMPLRARLQHVVLPQLAPQIAAAARAGLSLTWKIVLVVEFLGRPNGVGFQIHLYFQLFDVGLVLAYAFAFITVMMAVEYAVLQPWERRIRRWRTA